jgi:hypothetical protein
MRKLTIGRRGWVLVVRGEREIGAGRDDLHALLEYCGVLFIVATDDAARALTAAEDVMGFARS